MRGVMVMRGLLAQVVEGARLPQRQCCGLRRVWWHTFAFAHDTYFGLLFFVVLELGGSRIWGAGHSGVACSAHGSMGWAAHATVAIAIARACTRRARL